MENKGDQIPSAYVGQLNHHDNDQSTLLRSIIGGDWKIVMAILNSDHFVANAEEHQVPSILHIVCSISTVPLDVIDRILNIYGNSFCEIYDEDGNLPIHVACSTLGISASVIGRLLGSSPLTNFARSEIDSETPLDLLLKQGNNGLQILSAILKDLPRSCFINEETGTSIFHEVCSVSIPESIFIQILELHPDIAFLKDSTHGNSIAHMICSQRHGSALMLREVMTKNQDLASLKDNYGNLPLHVVNSEQDSEEMIKILLYAYPKGIMSKNADMETPFSSRLMRSCPKKIKALIQYSSPSLKAESLCTRNAAGMLPIDLSFFHMQHYLSSKCHNCQVEITSDVLKTIHQKDTHLQNMVESLMILLHATCNKTNNQFSQHHASFWLSYPLITKLMIQRYPELLTQYDCIGNLPLHIIAKSDLAQKSRILCTSCHEEIKSGIFFWLNENHRHCRQCNCRWKKDRITTQQVPLVGYQGDGILKDLINVSNPVAIKSVDPEGNLPLHLCLRSGKSWFEHSVKDLVDKVPETICSRDNEGAPPVMLAAHGGCDLGTIYLLLRKYPDCVSR